MNIRAQHKLLLREAQKNMHSNLLESTFANSLCSNRKTCEMLVTYRDKEEGWRAGLFRRSITSHLLILQRINDMWPNNCFSSPNYQKYFFKQHGGVDAFEEPLTLK